MKDMKTGAATADRSSFHRKHQFDAGKVELKESISLMLGRLICSLINRSVHKRESLATLL
jgi:hypothetical protein